MLKQLPSSSTLLDMINIVVKTTEQDKKVYVLTKRYYTLNQIEFLDEFIRNSIPPRN